MNSDVCDEHRKITPYIKLLVTQCVKTQSGFELHSDTSLKKRGLTRGFYCYLTFPTESLVPILFIRYQLVCVSFLDRLDSSFDQRGFQITFCSRFDSFTD